MRSSLLTLLCDVAFSSFKTKRSEASATSSCSSSGFASREFLQNHSGPDHDSKNRIVHAASAGLDEFVSQACNRKHQDDLHQIIMSVIDERIVGKLVRLKKRENNTENQDADHDQKKKKARSAARMKRRVACAHFRRSALRPLQKRKSICVQRRGTEIRGECPSSSRSDKRSSKVKSS